ncbi:MAG: sulfotransferase domain-containing protein [Candidatus Bathyarchaeota archaeon]|nr:sulfotransferase domain-containing protein [Candidatus Bathyarchaeota archaeon]
MGIGVKALVPSPLRQAMKAGLRYYRMFTSQIRVLPDFIIIGGQRCGTTSLYNNLVRHPCIAPAFRKEAHFFDVYFDRGISWYRSLFPTSIYRYYAERMRGGGFATGEASPYYIFHPHAPKRVFDALPRVKLIAILRNPVDRSYSHYSARVRRGVETLSFRDAIEREEERLRGELERILEDENYYSPNHRLFSYLSRGVYVDQLRRWMGLFPREQLLILKSEDFLADPQAELNRVTDFLDLPNWETGGLGRYNVGRYPEMGADMRRRLVEYFEPHNQRLYKYLGVDFGWG